MITEIICALYGSIIGMLIGHHYAEKEFDKTFDLYAKESNKLILELEKALFQQVDKEDPADWWKQGKKQN